MRCFETIKFSHEATSLRHTAGQAVLARPWFSAGSPHFARAFPVSMLSVPCPHTPQADHEGWSPWELTRVWTGGAAGSRRKVQADRTGQPAPRAAAMFEFAVSWPVSWPWRLRPEHRPGRGTSTPPLKGTRVAHKDRSAPALL